jgi:hypothetical protein
MTSSDRAAANGERRPNLFDVQAKDGDGAGVAGVGEHLHRGSVEAAAE